MTPPEIPENEEARLEALDEDRDAGFAQAPAGDRVEDRVHHVEAGD